MLTAARRISCSVCARQQAQAAVSVCGTDTPSKAVRPPPKIKRESADLLKALASTLKTDPTAAHFKFLDDPFFIPATDVSKKAFALSKEAGRKMARMFAAEWPTLFMYAYDEPRVDAFRPRLRPPLEEVGATEAELNDYIDKEWVSAAWKVFENLTDKSVDISPTNHQRLLELLCYHNSADSPDSDWPEEFFYRSRLEQPAKPVWQEGGSADVLFEIMTTKSSSPLAYSALVCGLAKWGALERAEHVFHEMKTNSLTPTLHAYNAILRHVINARPTNDARVQDAQNLLRDMCECGVEPNVLTFNYFLAIISRFKSPSNQQLMFGVLAEMRHLGVEMSPATYGHSLHVLRRSPMLRSAFVEVLRELNGKELRLQDFDDERFFLSLMNMAQRDLKDKELGYAVHQLYMVGNNALLITDASVEHQYFEQFLLLLMQTEATHLFYKVYRELVPMRYSPTIMFALNLLDWIELKDAWEFLGAIWTDVVSLRLWTRTRVLDRFIELLAVAPHETLSAALLQELAAVAGDIWQRVQRDVDAKETGNFRTEVAWSGAYVGALALTLARGGRTKPAWEMLQKCLISGSGRMPLLPLPESKFLLDLFGVFSHQKHFDACFGLLQIAAADSRNASHVTTMSDRLLADWPLSEKAKHDIAQVVARLNKRE